MATSDRSKATAAVLHWRCQPLTALPLPVLYRALALRSSVFVVEQRCIYQDLDGIDLDALLVVGSLPADPAESRAGGDDAEVVATARLLPPGSRFGEASIGRVCTAAALRGQGLGRVLMRFAIDGCRAHYPGQAIRISAQAYLRAFYGTFGFEAVSAEYLEDGIAHLEMRLPAAS
jgi:ElaA protein